MTVKKKKIVYIDWNTMKGIKCPTKEPFVSLKNLLDDLKDEILMPYSPSHLGDLNKNYEINKVKIDEDLEYLRSISNNIIIAKYFGIDETIVENRDLIQFFHEIGEDEKNEKPVSQSFEDLSKEFGIDFSQLLSSINFKSIIANKENIEKTESGKNIQNLFSSFFETGNFLSLLEDVSKLNEKFETVPESFNDLRKGLSKDLKLDANISNWDSAIRKLDEYLPSTILGKSFSEKVCEDVAIFHKQPIFFDYYISAYNQLGLYGFRPDTLTKKNRFSNTTEDAFHSFYGAHSFCFITSDKVLYHRSKSLFEAFEINSKVFKTFKVKDHQLFCDEIEKELRA